MNTDVLVVGGGVEIERWFREVEATLSRFDPESSLSQLNRHPGRWVLVPPLLHRAVQMALGAARATEGAFDPTILDARRGLALLETQGCRGLMVSDDGNLILSPGMEEYLHAEA